MENWTELDEIEYQDKKKELLFCIFLGWLGAHKFYRKKIVIGLLYFITMGFFCIAWIIDIVTLAKELSKMKKAGVIKESMSRHEDIDVENIVLTNGRKRLNAIKEYRERTGVSEKVARGVIDATYDSLGIDVINGYCRRCGSQNVVHFFEDKVIVKGRTKIETSINLNPFKPFTILNHEEKVVSKPWTTRVKKYMCNDCGHIFQHIQKKNF